MLQDLPRGKEGSAGRVKEGEFSVLNSFIFRGGGVALSQRKGLIHVSRAPFPPPSPPSSPPSAPSRGPTPAAPNPPPVSLDTYSDREAMGQYGQLYIDTLLSMC